MPFKPYLIHYSAIICQFCATKSRETCAIMMYIEQK